jgi:hypothetical protein
MLASIERRLAQFFRHRSKAGGRQHWGCPGEAEIAAYADHATTGREREKIEAHLADCEFCLSQVAILARIEETELAGSVPASLLSRARDLVDSRHSVSLIPAWSRVAVAAACVAVAVTLSVRYAHFRNPPASLVGTPSGAQPSLQNPSAGEVRGGAENARLSVLFPAPQSTVARKDLQFRWKPVDGALYYEVRMLTAEGDVVWDQKTEGNSIRLPGDVGVETGHRYYLLIRADLPEGRTVESKAVGFSVAGDT